MVKKTKKDKIEKSYSGSGRWTVARQAVLDVFLKVREHLTAEDVYLEVRKLNSGIGIATVYRNLEYLTKHGFITRYQFSEVKARYELKDDKKKQHHHLICVECGKIKNYSEFLEREMLLMKNLEKKLSKKYNYKIYSQQLYFYGLCEKCQSK